METRTGAFFPIIPFNFAATELHSLLIDGDPLSNVLTKSSALKIEPSKLLNILWQVKKFNVITRWEFKEPGSIYGAIATYNPSKEGEHIEYDVYVTDPAFDTSDPPIPTNDWINEPIGFGIGNVKLTETPYPEDRNLARQQIRDSYGNVDQVGTVYSSSEYPIERSNLIAQFNLSFQNWTDKVTALLAGLSTKPDEIYGSYKTDLQRQLEAIPNIKAANKYDLLDFPLEQFDEEYSQNSEDPYFYALIATNAKNQAQYIKDWVDREADLEMFELSGGFKKKYDFKRWHMVKKYGDKCHRVQNAVNSRVVGLPNGFYFDVAEGKLFASANLAPNPVFNLGWKYRFEETYTAFFNGSGDDPVPITRLAYKELNFSAMSYTDSENQIGLDVDRLYPNQTFVYGAGSVMGGEYHQDVEPYTLDYEVKYGSFFNEDGDAIQNPNPPESFNTPEANKDSFVYSGPYFVGPDDSIAREFFSDFGQLARSFLEAENGPIGKFRIESFNETLIDEVPIYGPQAIYQDLTIILRVAERYDNELE